MTKKPKPKRARTERRILDRTTEKLREQRTKLYALEPGGSADRPIELSSPSQVEIDAESLPCPVCGDRVRLEGPHEVEEHKGERLRVARVVCIGCRARWSRYYRLGPVLN
ncbi:MAG: hypothetical protein HOW73_39580 [Polyangiaceae bacterium]|nr:hypothetical protein [Polyangiaceae bacterium]